MPQLLQVNTPFRLTFLRAEFSSNWEEELKLHSKNFRISRGGKKNAVIPQNISAGESSLVSEETFIIPTILQ